ncbi:unnamed protein product [Parnassius mnemosyne]|uniref:Uncharacterized protein n=1 Tax=Parnassius mnemosyne TaxID=213953 RepID=A0AAV1L796_9NEOP
MDRGDYFEDASSGSNNKNAKGRVNCRARSRTRNPHRGRSKSRSQSRYRKFPLCWYHAKFGNRANKCVAPCDYKTGNCKDSP